MAKKKRLSDLAGIWADMPEEEFNQIKRNIQKARKESDQSFGRRIKRFQF